MTDSARIEVTPVLDQSQVEAWLDDGYLVLPQLLTTAEIEQLKQEIVAIARGRYPSENLQPLADSVPDEQVLNNILAIHHPHLISPVVVKYVRHAEICGVLSQITAAHLRHWDGSVKCMQTMLFVKPPGYPGQAWHQDELYIQTRDRSLVGVWVAIDDACVANGCMHVIPGSHRTGYFHQQRQHDDPQEYDEGPQSYGFDDAAAVAVEVKAGSVIFFNGYLLHRSLKNRSAGYRRALVCHYMNAWSLLPWTTPDLPMDSNGDRRGIILAAGQDPYAWKGIAAHHRTPYLRRCAANADTVAKQAGIDLDKLRDRPETPVPGSGK